MPQTRDDQPLPGNWGRSIVFHLIAVVLVAVPWRLLCPAGFFHFVESASSAVKKVDPFVVAREFYKELTGRELSLPDQWKQDTGAAKDGESRRAAAGPRPRTLTLHEPPWQRTELEFREPARPRPVPKWLPGHLLLFGVAWYTLKASFLQDGWTIGVTLLSLVIALPILAWALPKKPSDEPVGCLFFLFPLLLIVVAAGVAFVLRLALVVAFQLLGYFGQFLVLAAPFFALVKLALDAHGKAKWMEKATAGQWAK